MTIETIQALTYSDETRTLEMKKTTGERKVRIRMISSIPIEVGCSSA